MNGDPNFLFNLGDMENHKHISSLLKTINLKEFQKCDDFHILKFEDHLDVIPHQTHSRKCEFFQIIFSESYHVDVAIDDLSYSIKNEPLISFLTPLQTLSVDVKTSKENPTGFMLTFEPSFLNNGWSDFEIQQKFPFFNLNYSPLYFLERGQGVYKALFEKIYEVFKDTSDENIEILRSYLNILLFESRKSFFNGSIKNNAKSRAHEIAFSFESLIRQFAHTRNGLDFYAEKLNISTVYLSECVKKTRNQTAKQIIQEYIILESTTYLKQTHQTIDQISDELGFTATSNFINFFKKHTGITPALYRKNNKT